MWLSPDVADKVIAIDGKTLRGSRDGRNAAIHVVSAFASEAGIVLGQIKTQEKSNEITAIPELLEWIDVRGTIVTIDAMGCQKSITQSVIKYRLKHVTSSAVQLLRLSGYCLRCDNIGELKTNYIGY